MTNHHVLCPKKRVARRPGQPDATFPSVVSPADKDVERYKTHLARSIHSLNNFIRDFGSKSKATQDIFIRSMRDKWRAERTQH